MNEPIFISLEQALYIQRFEAERTNSPTVIRDQPGLEAALAAPQATFDGRFLMDVFEMAATYVAALVQNLPFLDANKRTAVGCALAFLSVYGFLVIEKRNEELARSLGPGCALLFVSGFLTPAEKMRQDSVVDWEIVSQSYQELRVTITDKIYSEYSDFSFASQYVDHWNGKIASGRTPDSAIYDIALRIVDKYTIEHKGLKSLETVNFSFNAW